MKYFRSSLIRRHDPQTSNGPNKTLKANTRRVIHRLQSLVRHSRDFNDPVFLNQVNYRILSLAEQLEEFLHGKLSFASTETWRSVYEELLANCHQKRYLSVALVQSDDYWRDKPGQSSLEFNYRLLADGFLIHRLFIIDDFFWPPGAPKPSRDVLDWIAEQYQRGIEVTLVRLSEISEESGLACDMGIYGKRAVGYQLTDSSGRTTRFELCFDRDSVQIALDCWKNLQLYAISLETLLDRAED